MSTAQGVDRFLTVLLSLPALFTLLVLSVDSLAVLLWRRASLGATARVLLIALCMVSGAAALALIALAIASGGGPPPPGPPIPIR
ncbi:MAG: hypothetical protein GX649_16090 [Chloroflexi bacterium]|nr:hypothetical protein [Chloroflexota bacterium]